jgi:membrane-associated phospholipid phosphatase
VVSGSRLAAQRPLIPIEDPRLRGYTPVDLITGVYLALTVLLLLFGWRRIPHGGGVLLVHIGVFLSILLLGFIPRRGHILLMFFRDTYPLWGLPLLYRDVGLINRVLHKGFYDTIVLRWEHSFFGLFPSVWLRVWFPNATLDEFFHFSYLSYYTLVPTLGFWFYLHGREELCRVFATTMMLTFITCYLAFILFPVAGPHYVFVQEGGKGPFARIVRAMLYGGASRGTAFPSSHVAGAVAVFLTSCRFERPLAPLFGILGAGIFFGVVYCGLHYGVDALAGLAVGMIGALLGPRLHRTLLRQTRLAALRVRFPKVADGLLDRIRRRGSRGRLGT